MKNINLKEQIVLQLKFSFVLIILLSIHPIYFLYYNETVYNSFGFYFDSSFKEFKIWFPRYYFLAFLIIKVIQFIVIVSFIKLILWFSQYLKLKPECTENSFNRFFTSNLLVFLNYLFFSLLVYYNLDFISNSKQINFILNQTIARFFVLNSIFQICVLLFFNKEQLLGALKNFFFKPTLPYNIALLRIIFFGYLILIYLSKLFTMLPIVGLKNKEGLPFIGWLIDALPVNPSLYIVIAIIGIISCLLIIIGYKTRISLIINAFTIFYIMATPNFFGKLWHEQIVIWISWFFVFSRCFDVFSIDAKLNKTEIVKSADYNFPIKFVWISLGIIYFWAGFYKLWDGGFDWALSDSMINQIQLEWAQHYDEIPAIRIDKFPNLLHVLGMLVIFFEMLYIFLLFNHKLKWIAILGGLLMHNILGYFIYISFFFLLQVFYIFYFDFTFLIKNKAGKQIPKTFNYSKLAFNFGITIVIVNFIFGMFNIDSYPFSSYPSYSSIIEKDLKFIEFECENKLTNLKIGKQNKFRWEDYGWLEYNLIKDIEVGKDVKDEILNYWEIWKSKNPQFCDCDIIKVNLLVRPLNPERVHEIKKIKTIDTLYSNNNNLKKK
jgi:uncharacterized membrane protein YphA (DoxX/SURF4 family)